jgi:hypothetical protein
MTPRERCNAPGHRQQPLEPTGREAQSSVCPLTNKPAPAGHGHKEIMDHQEKRHQHHEKERHERIEREKEKERAEEKLPVRIHPAWFVGLGVLLILIIVLGWTFLL